jgi:hypothetical protein
MVAGCPTASPRCLRRHLHPLPGRSEGRPRQGRSACFRRAHAPFSSRASALDHGSMSSSPRSSASTSTSAACTSTPPSTTILTPSTCGGGWSGWTWPRAAEAAPSPPFVAGRVCAQCLISLGSMHPSSTRNHAGSRGSCGTVKTAPASFVPFEPPSSFGTLAGTRTDPPPELLPCPLVPSQQHIDLLPELLPSQPGSLLPHRTPLSLFSLHGFIRLRL